MDDKDIIELYILRSERALKESRTKYGRLCRACAMRIMGSREDAEKADNPDGKEIIVIPSDAVSETVKDSVKLVYKYKLFEALYKEPEVNINQIAAELGISEEALEKMTIEIIPAPETPGDDGGDESGDESEG